MKQKTFFHISIITALIFTIWGKTLNQGLWGDGFYWFNPYLIEKTPKIIPINLTNPVYNLLSRNIFKIIIPIFRENQSLYQLLQIVFLILLMLSIYITTLKLTKKLSIALVSCTIFVSNYGGLYEMMAEGNLNRFLERVPNLIIIVLGIYFLSVFIQNRTRKYLLFSFMLYSIGVYLGHFGSFVLPFFIFYPIILLFNTKKPFQSLLLGGLIATLFLVSNFLIIRNSDQRSGNPISFYLSPEERFVEKTFYMTTPLIIPREIVINLAHHIPNITYPYVSLVRTYTILLIILAPMIGYLLYKKDSNLGKLYLVCVLSMLAGTALMIYTDPIKYDPFKNFGAGRHLFIQSIFYAIILSSIVVIFFDRKKKKLLVLLFLFVFVVYNVNLSWRDISSTQYIYEGNKLYLNYLKSIKTNLKPKDTVVVGSKLMGASIFANDFFIPKDISFITAPEDIQKIVKNDKKTVHIIDIDYNPTSDGYYKSKNVKIVDFTNCYQSFNFNLNELGTKDIKYFESLCNIK